MSWDKYNLFSDDQAITADAVSTDYLNLGEPKTTPGAPAAQSRDIGGGNNVPIVIEVSETFATLTSLTCNIEMATDAAFTSPVVAGSTGAIPVASLVKGKILPMTIVPPGADLQYMRIAYDVTGSDATAGKVFAGIKPGVHTNG